MFTCHFFSIARLLGTTTIITEPRSAQTWTWHKLCQLLRSTASCYNNNILRMFWYCDGQQIDNTPFLCKFIHTLQIADGHLLFAPATTRCFSSSSTAVICSFCCLGKQLLHYYLFCRTVMLPVLHANIFPGNFWCYCGSEVIFLLGSGSLCWLWKLSDCLAEPYLRVFFFYGDAKPWIDALQINIAYKQTARSNPLLPGSQIKSGTWTCIDKSLLFVQSVGIHYSSPSSPYPGSKCYDYFISLVIEILKNDRICQWPYKTRLARVSLYVKMERPYNSCRANTRSIIILFLITRSPFCLRHIWGSCFSIAK